MVRNYRDQSPTPRGGAFLFMALGAKTYTSVVWTTGDTVTETKLDNMVDNDQAHDSHAAQGYSLDNNVGYYQKNVAGTNTQLVNVDASDIAKFGNSTGVKSAFVTTLKMSAYLGSAQAYTSASGIVVVQIDTESYDTGANFNTGTYTYTVPITGYYLVIGQITMAVTADQQRCSSYFYVDGAEYQRFSNQMADVDSTSTQFSRIIYLTATQTVDLRFGSDQNDTIVNARNQTWLQVHLLSVD